MRRVFQPGGERAVGTVAAAPDGAFGGGETVASVMGGMGRAEGLSC